MRETVADPNIANRNEHTPTEAVFEQVRPYVVGVVGAWGLECWVWGVGCGVRGSGFGIWDLGFGVWRLGFGVWCLRSGVWCLGFEVWGLGFGISGLLSTSANHENFWVFGAGAWASRLSGGIRCTDHIYRRLGDTRVILGARA